MAQNLIGIISHLIQPVRRGTVGITNQIGMLGEHELWKPILFQRKTWKEN